MKNPFKREKIKSPGFFTPMDIAPGEFPSCYAYQFSVLKTYNLNVIKEHYGERCQTKDTDDFPELLEPPYMNNEKDWGRCPVCLVYENFDAYWEALYYVDDDLEVS